MKVGAGIMVHNMAPFVGACIRSLQWADAIFLLDDHSTDDSAKIAASASTVPIVCERSPEVRVAFEQGELSVRNHVIDRAFQVFDIDVLVLADADELFAESLRDEISIAFRSAETDSIALSMWHLYDASTYIHFWELEANGTLMIDPHTRVVRRGRFFVPLAADGSHPIIPITEKTKCLHGPHHFHLKYHRQSRFPNYSLFFLPKRPTETDLSPFLRPLPFHLPNDIAIHAESIEWTKFPYYQETPHYPNERIKFRDPKDALIHPSKYYGL